MRRSLDQALLAGADVGIFPNGGLRDIDPATIDDPDAENAGVEEWHKKKLANPFHPEVARLQDDANRSLMELVQEYPQVRTAFFNTEVVDALACNRNKAGLELMQAELGFSEEEIGDLSVVAPGVIATDDQRYRFHKFLYKRGNGLATANQRTADMIHRYRSDILTINDPYRETALLDMFPGLDVIGTWTYTNPDPKLMLYVETLRAACRPTGQVPLSTVTMLNYPGELAPTDVWMLMGPGRVKVTTWINLSRAPRILGYYYSSACNPVTTADDRVTYSTSVAIQELSEKVFRPYGPMITRLEVAPRRIAVLSSAGARVHGGSPQLRGGYANLQIYHFYSVMAMAHLQADVVFDETIERFGLDGYDVLVLPKCDALPEAVYQRVLAFRDRGGLIIADQYLRPDIPEARIFDFDFTYRKKVNANAIAKNTTYAEWNDQLQPESAELAQVTGVTALDDQRIMESYAQRLKTTLSGTLDSDVDCDEPTVLFNMLERHDAKYLVVINDKRTYDDRIGEHKAVLGRLLPQATTVRLNEWKHPRLFAYDMLERAPLDVSKTTRADGSRRFEFTVHLTTLGGTIVALMPAALDSVAVRGPDVMRRGRTYPVTVTISDYLGNPLRGLQPVHLRFVDPEGEENEFTGYYCAENGTLAVEFTPALNDVSGTWRVEVAELTAGLEAATRFEVED